MHTNCIVQVYAQVLFKYTDESGNVCVCIVCKMISRHEINGENFIKLRILTFDMRDMSYNESVAN